MRKQSAEVRATREDVQREEASADAARLRYTERQHELARVQVLLLATLLPLCLRLALRCAGA